MNTGGTLADAVAPVQLVLIHRVIAAQQHRILKFIVGQIQTGIMLKIMLQPIAGAFQHGRFPGTDIFPDPRTDQLDLFLWPVSYQRLILIAIFIAVWPSIYHHGATSSLSVWCFASFRGGRYPAAFARLLAAARRFSLYGSRISTQPFGTT